MSFREKVVLITGGSSGIGLSAARQFSALGAHVWIVARSTGRLEAAIEQIQSARQSPAQSCGFVSADVSDETQAEAAAVQVAEQAGPVDILINAAGVVHPGYFQELDQDIFRWMMEVNYFGTVYITKAIIPSMIERRSGHIVNISSLLGQIGFVGYTAYSASKFAVRGYSDALRSELKPKGVGVSLVLPPDTDTPQLAYENQYKPYEIKEVTGEMKTMSPDEVAGAILSGVQKGRYLILPGFESKLLYWLSSVLGAGVYPIVDLIIARAQRNHREKVT